MEPKFEFKKRESYRPRNEREKALVKAFKSLESEEETAHFLRDMLTPAEIEEFANRLEIARLLNQGRPYLDISKKVGTSTTTVTRVAHWLFKGCGGYHSVLKKLFVNK
ncbi:hypothetical protein HGB07_02575 [Candidatus Roizmanbacteria bacterium]|nr:hypothetical protein [Candidatus Roizmanbacteria bacterium]